MNKVVIAICGVLGVCGVLCEVVSASYSWCCVLYGVVLTKQSLSCSVRFVCGVCCFLHMVLCVMHLVWCCW